MHGVTRGERNNNPGNIRKSGAVWLGKIVPSQDANFEQFDTDVDGIRAIAKLLVTYYAKYKCNTVAKIITKWAPGSDNNPTDAYIKTVCSFTKTAPTDVIDPMNADTMVSLVSGIIEQENGRIGYPDMVIRKAVDTALGISMA